MGVGDFVSVCPEDASEAVYIAQIIALWEDDLSSHRKQFHARWFSRSSDTVLGEVRVQFAKKRLIHVYTLVYIFSR